MIHPAFVPLPAVAWIDLLNRVIDGVDDLACRGYLPHPDEPGDEWPLPPEGVIAELAGLIASCRECRRGPSALGEHWLSLQLAKWQRARPIWKCACGAAYKTVGESSRDQQFYTVTKDGLLGGQAGVVKIDGKGKVTHSGTCRRCGRPFAATVSVRSRRPMQYAAPAKARSKPAVPGPDRSQVALFDESGLTGSCGETS